MIMTQIPGSRSRELMHEKEEIARRLISQGLTNKQITIQLRCSYAWLRRIRLGLEAEKQASDADDAAEPSEPSDNGGHPR